jgi:predicted DNA-binding transcriptional regulator AlpA
MMPVLRTREAAAYIGFAASTLEKMRVVGNGPRYIQLGPRAVGYLVEDLDDYARARRRASTSDAGDTIGEASEPPVSQPEPRLEPASQAASRCRRRRKADETVGAVDPKARRQRRQNADQTTQGP